MDAPGTARVRLLVPLAEIALRKPVVHPPQIRTPLTLWSDDPAIMRELAEDVALLAAAEGITLADLRSEAGKTRLVRLAWIAYNLRVHDGIARHQRGTLPYAQARVELQALVERAIRTARVPKKSTSGEPDLGYRRDVFREWLAIMRQVLGGDAAAAEAEVTTLIGDVAERMQFKIEGRGIHQPTMLWAYIRVFCDRRVDGELRHWSLRRRREVSGDELVSQSDEGTGDATTTRFDVTPATAPDSNPERAAILRVLREEWLKLCRDAVADGTLLVKDLAIFFLVGAGAPQLPGAEPDAGGARMTRNRAAADTLRRWQAHPEEIAGYFRDHLGYGAATAGELSDLLARELAIQMSDLTSAWIGQHYHHAKKRLLKRPAVAARLTELLRDAADASG